MKKAIIGGLAVTTIGNQRCRAGLAWNLHSVTREGTPLPRPIHRFQALPAPRGARSYLPPSGEGLEVNLWVRWLTRSRKVNGDKSMPGNRRRLVRRGEQ